MSGVQPIAGKPGIDWSKIHHRLEQSARLLEQKMEPGSAEKKKILKDRARILAREPEAARSEEGQLAVIEFDLAYERYALESSRVREVYPLKDLTPLPGTPPFVAGIINVRGQIVSVVDLKKFFDLPARGLPDFNKVIVIGHAAMEYGLLVDSVTGMRLIPREDIQPPLPTLTGVRAEYLRGVTADRLVILDVERLLSDPALRVDQETHIPPDQAGSKGTAL